MKIAVLSDIHGNMDAFEKVIEDIERCRPDAVYSLGDNIGYGPEPERVIRPSSVSKYHRFSGITNWRPRNPAFSHGSIPPPASLSP
jgi:Icc-related predicted phosphoesterase